MANALTYQSEFTGQQMDERFTAVATLTAALEALTGVVAQKYVKPSDGIPSTDMTAAVQASLAKAESAVQSLADYYTKTEVDQLLAAINGMDYVDVAALPTASASTMGKIYLLGPDASGYYAYYYTSYDGTSYSWVGPLGTTEISLSNYATKAELNQLDQEIINKFSDEPETITSARWESIYFVISSDVWTAVTGTIGSRYFSIKKGQILTIQANSLRKTQWAFLSSAPTNIQDGDTPAYADAVGLRSIDANNTETAVAPSDCWVYVRYRTATSTNSHFPQSITVFSPWSKIDKWDALEEATEGLEEDVETLEEATTQLDQKVDELGLSKSVSTPQADLEFSDEDGSVLVQFKNGHIKTKYFDSEDTALDYPAFKGFKNSEECPSFIDDYQKYLHTNFIRVAPGDIVRIKNVDLLDGILVNCYTYCYASQTQTPQVTGSWSKNDFVIPSNTNYIVIYGKPLTTDPLYIDGVIYGSEAFANNVYVEHKSSVKDESIFAGSTIPSGWYLSTNSEFSVNADPDDPWNGTGNSALTLKQIYDKIQELAEDYSDYFTLEQIGWDSSYGHTPLNSLHDAEFADWMDNDRILSIPVYRCVLCSKNVSVPSGLAKGQGGNTIPTVYMQFGVHADEKPCMRAMLNLMIHLCRDWKDNNFLNYLRWNVRLVVIPVLVPYSYVDGRRTNYNGININRNYYDGGYWDSFTDEPPMNGKGASALSEVETRLAYRCLLEYADSIAAFDWHTHGDFSSWKEVTTFNVPNYNDQGNAMNLIGIDLLKGLTVSGFVNHKLPYPLVNPDESIPTYQYIGDIESGTNLPLFSNIIRDIPSVIAATPEALYRYYDGQSGPVYNVFTDCINEEFVANAIFCSLRQIIVKNK